MIYVMAGLFAGALIFAYFQAKLFVGTILFLVGELSRLKTFSLGAPDKNPVQIEPIEEPSHPDFGLGAILDEVKQTEEGEI